MAPKVRAADRRALLDVKLAELTLLARDLCPAARVEVDTIRYEDEDGGVKVFPPAGGRDGTARRGDLRRHGSVHRVCRVRLSL
jgi:hypothetical protein